MAHPVVFRYLSYYTTLAEHAIHRLRQRLAFGRAGTCLFSSVQLEVTESTGWPHDHGPTNIGAMVKTALLAAHLFLATFKPLLLGWFLVKLGKLNKDSFHKLSFNHSSFLNFV